MNAEQKQRAIAVITKWWAADSNKAVLSTGYEMAGVLQEMIDAPEPAPGGYTNETELDYVRTYEALPVSGAFWPTSDEDACVALYTAPPANNESEQHLEMVNPPAPSVPDGWRSAIAKEFPLYDEDEIDEDKHCCERVMLQERKRLHKILATAAAIAAKKGGAA